MNRKCGKVNMIEVEQNDQPLLMLIKSDSI